MKKINSAKGLGAGILTMTMILTLCINAMADTDDTVIVGDTPYYNMDSAITIEKSADTGSEQQPAEADEVPSETVAYNDIFGASAVESDTPLGSVAESVAALEAVEHPGDSGATGQQGAPETGQGENGGASEAGGAGPGASLSRVELGFTIVSPAAAKGNLKVAEGALQLSDGSWASIGHDSNIRAPYYKLLREENDSSGQAWYVCCIDARRVGDYYTSDGSFASELWLKKSDCTAQNYIDIASENSKRQNIVRCALSLLGKGYEYAANGPDKYDCSGYVHHVFEEQGMSVPRTSGSICVMGGQETADRLRPGDLVARQGHVGIYIGNGIFLHASETSTGIIAEKLNVYNAGPHPFTNYVNPFGD